MNIDKPFKGKLFNWEFVFADNLQNLAIRGACPGHPTLKGDWIQTSRVIRVFVETENSCYELDLT
jgi:hypothetical protein